MSWWGRRKRRAETPAPPLEFGHFSGKSAGGNACPTLAVPTATFVQGVVMFRWPLVAGRSALGPRLSGLAGVHAHHRDAVLDRADQPAQVAADAFHFVHMR